MGMSNIRLESFHVHRTYAGTLEGRPSTEHSIESAKKRAKRLWGERPTLVIPPTLRTTHGRDKLPEWEYHLWLDGPPTEPQGFGTHLVVIYWSETLTVNVDDIISQIDWKAHAEDWEP